MASEVVAVIPTYRPTKELTTLVDSLLPQVAAVVVADDASPCTCDSTLRVASSPRRVHLIRYKHNAGIARGLNGGLSFAHANDAEYLLTIDQDSFVNPTFVADLLASLKQATLVGLRIGVIGPKSINDRSGSINYPIAYERNWPTTAEIFQSGSLWSIGALQSIGGFDERLAMDAVDAEACLGLREVGYSIALASEVSLSHSWGSARQISLFGRQVAVTEHSRQRRESIVRNRLRLLPRELRQSPTQALRSLRRLVAGTALSVAVEEDRKGKALATARALFPRTHRG